MDVETSAVLTLVELNLEKNKQITFCYARDYPNKKPAWNGMRQLTKILMIWTSGMVGGKNHAMSHLQTYDVWRARRYLKWKRIEFIMQDS